MATGKNTRSHVAKRAAEAPSEGTPTDVPAEARPAELTAKAVRETFRRDEEVRAALATGLKERGANIHQAADRATKAFEKFNPSMWSEAERSREHYLEPAGNLKDALKNVIEEGAERWRNATGTRKLELHLTPEIKAKMEQPPERADGAAGRIALDDLLSLLNRDLFADVAYRSSIYTACEAEVEANRLLAGIDAPAAAKESDDGDDDPRDLPNDTAEALVRKRVNVQMGTAGSPEEKLLINVEKRANPASATKSIQSISLRDGASDVTAFHDFNSLQIAFHHVWTEIFDGDLTALGKELYEEYVNIDNFNYRDPRYPTINTVDDLKSLMAEIRRLLAQTSNLVPDDLKDGAAKIDSMFSSKGPTITIPGITARASSSAGNAAPDSSGEKKDRLFTLLESLDKILKSRYEFTVFAPKSINFGVMITYRQTWVPENYQVGELVSTIPLAPKEVKRYTTRKVVKKTRNVKELEDSLQMRRTESADTGRVDAEIVDRAQNRNSFNFTAS